MPFATVTSRIKNSARNAVAVSAVTVIALAGSFYLPPANLMYRKAAHNAMSHAGLREGDAMTTLSDPRNYGTRGPYQGFSFSGPKSVQGNRNRMDLNAIYLGLDANPLPKSKYRPTRLSGANTDTFYSIADFIDVRAMFDNTYFSKEGLERLAQMEAGEVLTQADVGSRFIPASNFTNLDLGSYTLSFGKDARGIYTSIYDSWDFNPSEGFFSKSKSRGLALAGFVLPKLGTPIKFYDRFYWSDIGIKIDKLSPHEDVFF